MGSFKHGLRSALADLSQALFLLQPTSRFFDKVKCQRKQMSGVNVVEWVKFSF